MDRWIDGSMDRWIDGSMDRWIDGSMDRWIDSCFFVVETGFRPGSNCGGSKMRLVGFEPAIFGSEDQRSADCAIADLTPLFQGPEARPLNLIVCWSRGSTGRILR